MVRSMSTAEKFVTAVSGGPDAGESTSISTTTDAHGYRFTSRWASIDGRAEPVELVIIRHDGGPVRASAVRQLPLGQILEEGRREATSFAEQVLGARDFLGSVAGVSLEGFAGFVAAGPRRGRALTRDVLEEVAAVYRKAYFEGESVQQAVAEHFVISPDAATKRIMRARAEGLLEGVGRPR
jgi:hypothetical protein